MRLLPLHLRHCHCLSSHLQFFAVSAADNMRSRQSTATKSPAPQLRSPPSLPSRPSWTVSSNERISRPSAGAGLAVPVTVVVGGQGWLTRRWDTLERETHRYAATAALQARGPGGSAGSPTLTPAPSGQRGGTAAPCMLMMCKCASEMTAGQNRSRQQATVGEDGPHRPNTDAMYAHTPR